jgi:hypothetical protein
MELSSLEPLPPLSPGQVTLLKTQLTRKVAVSSAIQVFRSPDLRRGNGAD